MSPILLLAAACAIPTQKANDTVDDTAGPVDTADTADSDSGGDVPVTHTVDDAAAAIDFDSFGISETAGMLYYTENNRGTLTTVVPTGSLDGDLVRFEGATYPARLGDLDGDGRRDLLLESDMNISPTFQFYSATGALIASVLAESLSTAPWDCLTPGGGQDWTVIGCESHRSVYAPDDTALATPILAISTDDHQDAAEGDVTGDGVDDHLIWQLNDDDYVYPAGKLWVIDGTDRGDEDEVADAFATITGLFGNGGRTVGAVREPVDVDGDGYLDVPIRDGGDSAGLSVYALHDGGDVDTTASWMTLTDVGGADLLDFDGDGVQDIVGQRPVDYIETIPSFSVAFAPSPGRTDFRTLPTWDLNQRGQYVVSDVDLDGIDDMVFQVEGDDVIALFPGGTERGIE